MDEVEEAEFLLFTSSGTKGDERMESLFLSLTFRLQVTTLPAQSYTLHSIYMDFGILCCLKQQLYLWGW